MTMEFLLLFLVYALIFGFFCGYLAGEKGRDSTAWFFLGLVFGILALLVLIGLPSEQNSSSEDSHAPSRSAVTSRANSGPRRDSSNVRLCPHCIQEIHQLATACPHCQRDLPELERCSDTVCRKIINPTDDRCEDDEGNPFCGDLHRRRQQALAKSPAYVPLKRGTKKRLREESVKCDRCGLEVLEGSMSAHVVSGCTSMR